MSGSRVLARPGPGYIVLLVALAALLWLPRLRGPLDLRYDAGVYYVLGTALAEGKGYRLLNEPGAIQAIQYPPLLPAITAAHQWVLGSSDPAAVGPWLRRTFLVLSVCYTLAAFALGRRYLKAGHAFLVALVTTLHVQTVFLSDLLSAEIPFALATILFFLLVGGREGSPQPRSPIRSGLAGLLAAAAFALRTAGVALLGAWALDSLLQRQGRQLAARVAVALIAVGSWQAYTTSVKHGEEYRHPAYEYQRAPYQFYNVGYLENIAYRDPFQPELGRASSGDLTHRVMSNLRYIPMSLGEAVSMPKGWWTGEIQKVNDKIGLVPLPLWLADVALNALSVPIVIGLILLARRGHRLFVLYVAASLALITLTPWPGQFTRYLIPLTPFLMVAFLAPSRPGGTDPVPAARMRRWRKVEKVLLLATGVVLVQQVYTLRKAYTKHHGAATYTDARGRRHEYALFFYEETWRLHDAGLEWLASEGKRGETVAAATPQWVYLKTGLQAVMPPYEADPRTAQRLVDEIPVEYLLVDNLSFLDVGRRYTRPMLETFPDRWKLVYATVDSGPRIYRRVPAEGKKVSPAVGTK